jgi:hypothetical protein
MEEHRREVGFKDDFYYHEMELLHYDLHHAGLDLQKALAVSYIQLLLPVNLWHRYFFFRKTNRKTTQLTINDILEYVMFFITALTLYKWWDFTHYNPTNEYKDPEESYEKGEMFMLNVMWEIHINGYRFDFLLALVAFLTWFKLFVYFRASLTFGPMFKILQ